MHHHAEVYLETNKDFETQIENIMELYDEQKEVILHTEEWTDNTGRLHQETYWSNPNGFLDWYQIGGRWTGEHDGYDPEKDEANWERCIICHGTGIRDNDPCNACSHYENLPKGMSVKWPTAWAQYNGDIAKVEDISKELTCHTLIVKGKVFMQEEWTGKEIDFDGNVKKKLDELGITTGYMVTVDYHF